MGLDILPKGGNDFHAQAGYGNFKSRLHQLTNSAGFRTLKDKQGAITAAVAKRALKIRGYGGLTEMQRRSALLEIEQTSNSGSFTVSTRHKVKEILDHYALEDKPTPKSEPLSAHESAAVSSGQSLDAAAAAKVQARLRINRDPDSGFGSVNPNTASSERTGLASASSTSVNPNTVSPARTGLASSSNPSAAHYSSAANRGEVMSAGLSSGRVERSDHVGRPNLGSVSRGQNNLNSKSGGLKPGGTGNASFKNNLLRSLK